MSILLYLIIISLFAFVTFLFLKKFRILSKENGRIPKEFMPVVYILIIIFIAMVSLMIYTSFFTGVHYNF